jgi:general secretion pathway protein G
MRRSERLREGKARVRENAECNHFSLRRRAFLPGSSGFTLLELIVTLTILTILTIGIIPLVKISVKRQREQQLRESLREMRMAIEQFHRDTIGGPCGGVQQAVTPPVTNSNTGGNTQPQPFVDPRSNVMISDCTIFGVDNPDRYPPDLETLVKGVNVAPRSGGGGRGNLNVNATDVDNPTLATKKKVYLRSIPVDPMTGQAEWDLRSSYDSKDAGSWGGENVFDVHSKSTGTALNGEKYSDW